MIRPDNAFYLGRSVRGLKVINDKYPGANGMDDLDAPGSVTIDYIRTDGDRCRTFYLNGVYTGPFTFGRVFMFHTVKGPTGDEYVEFKGAKNFNYSPEEVIELGEDIYAIRIGIFPSAPLSYKDGDPFLYELSSAKPHYKSLQKAYKKESGQEFLRTTIEGSVAFFDKDFEYISGSPLESDFVFLLARPNSRNTGLNFGRHIYAKSRFAKTDCSIDFAARKCEPDLQVLDEYTAILDRYDDKYDLVKMAPGISKISISKRAVMQLYAPGSQVVTNVIGASSWDISVTSVIDSREDLENKHNFSYFLTANELYLKEGDYGSETEKYFPGILRPYAGVNGVWKNSNGYKIRLEPYVDESTGVNFGRLFLSTPEGRDIYSAYAVDGVSFDQGDIHLPNAFSNRMDIIFDEWMQDYIDSIDPNSSPSGSLDIDNPFVYAIYRRLLVDVGSVGGVATQELPLDDFTGSYPNYSRCVGLGRDALTGTLLCSTETSEEPTKYGINDYEEYFVAPSLSAGAAFGRVIPVMRTNWANASVWFAYGTDYPQFDSATRSSYTLEDSFALANVIRALLRKVAPGITHEATPKYSEFFYGSVNPISFNSFGVFLTQKTNVLKGDYDQAAQTAVTTLKEVMEMLRSCFRCYWFVENGKFRIEHISYFLNGRSYSGSPGVGLDMTILADRFNRRMLSSFQKAVEYDKDQLPARYEFDYADQASDFFTGVSIDVNASYVDKGQTESVSVAGFSADVDMMIASPELFANDGLALLCAVRGSSGWELPIVTDRALVDENGRTYQSAIQNYYASWAYLTRFYMHDMPGYDIDFSLSDMLSVTALKRCMTQTIAIPVSADPDLYSSIVTDLGHGRIESMGVDVDTLTAEIGLSYIPS